MGRQPWSDRLTVEECISLDIEKMSEAQVFRKGIDHFYTCRWTNAVGKEVASIGFWLKSGQAGNLSLQMSYAITDSSNDKASFDYPIELTNTPCGFGGIKYWFLCPLAVDSKPCRKRVGKLYLPPGTKYFGCRHCYNLTYRCQKEHDKKLDVLKKLPYSELIRRMQIRDIRAIRLVGERITKSRRT